MYGRINSAGLMGIDAYPLEIEVDISASTPSFLVVGLPDASISEARERVRTAITNSGFQFPFRKIVVNMAPADLKKEGASFDLSIAVGILSATGQLNSESPGDFLIVGELALDGAVRRINGVLPVVSMMAEMAESEGVRKILLPRENAREASLAEGIEVYPVDTLKEAVNILRAPELFPPFKNEEGEVEETAVYDVDFSDVKGQAVAKRALEVSASGGHNILMIGPPGSGKTMLARRLATILPPMGREEALEVTKIYSVSGLLPPDRSLLLERPFRAPHHSASRAGLVGGGQYPRPGEVSLAHRGVLFLDEMPEFDRGTLEVLRQPMEDGHVTISRASLSLTFPARFIMVASMNPCPCGFATDPGRECTCSHAQRQRYLMKISGPLLDRIDIHIEVPRLKFDEMAVSVAEESSTCMRERVVKAREIQKERFKKTKIFSNADMTARHLKKYCEIPEDSRKLLKTASEKLGLSARAYDRILKLSRTIADLAGLEKIATPHVAEAIQYRSMDRLGI